MARSNPPVGRATPSRSHGFTLVEVLVALAILSIALGSVLFAMSQAVDTTIGLRTRTLALWVAEERANVHLLQREWPNINDTEGTVEFGGQKWKWHEQVSTTPVEELRRMDIEVSLPNSDHVLAKLAVFFPKP
jgi:general secretion pathway protein I